MIPDRAKHTMCPEFAQLLISFANTLDTQTKPTLDQLRLRYSEQVQSYNESIDDNLVIRDVVTLVPASRKHNPSTDLFLYSRWRMGAW